MYESGHMCVWADMYLLIKSHITATLGPDIKYDGCLGMS